MALVFAGMAPHPPIMVPEVGRGEEAKVSRTLEGMREWAKELAAAKPDVLVMITPHGPVFRDAVAILGVGRLEGSLARFGAPQVRFSFDNDGEMARAIAMEAAERGVMTGLMDEEAARRYGVDTDLDHGLMVPLYFLREAGLACPLVPVAMGMLPRLELYTFGRALQAVAQEPDKRVALVASGDLSHRLTPDAPAGYRPEGAEFDRKVVEYIEKWDIPSLMDLEEGFCEAAGECGLRPYIMLAGALDGIPVETRVHSYEGPFGVGYLVASIRPQEGEIPSLWDQLVWRRDSRLRAVREKEHPLVRFARETLEAHVRGEEPPARPPLGEEFPPRAGVFVSIKKEGQLRGCIGTIAPTEPSLLDEVAANAVKSGTEDPRFDPVEEDELEDLVYSVDVLKEPEPIEGPEELDPRRYGVIVRKGYRQGLLLPNLEGIDTVAEQVASARQKAGIGPQEDVELLRFEVVRYK